MEECEALQKKVQILQNELEKLQNELNAQMSSNSVSSPDSINSQDISHSTLWTNGSCGVSDKGKIMSNNSCAAEKKVSNISLCLNSNQTIIHY